MKVKGECTVWVEDIQEAAVERSALFASAGRQVSAVAMHV